MDAWSNGSAVPEVERRAAAALPPTPASLPVDAAARAARLGPLLVPASAERSAARSSARLSSESLIRLMSLSLSAAR